ncbi:MAG TPA: NAD(P)-dependent oxidoreductase [Bryobacteraceae bacterium]|nr:NAD(P)-dependent oxidoreductase [Bryobacteraceae bacterium]
MTSTADERETVGLIGAGLLGTALATRLAAAGFAITGYDPDPGARVRLEALGGAMAESPEHVAQRCRRMLFSLPGPPQVVGTAERIEAHLRPGVIILDTTTGDPEVVEATAARLTARGVSYLDCEIGGSSRQTAAGEAIVICGGEDGAFSRCGDLLSAISSRVFHTGPAGTGTRMKLALNIAIGLHRAVLAESLEFAAANGIARERALEILKSGPAYSKAMDVKGGKMLARDFTPEARLAQHLKDVRLILKTGEATGARLPLSRVHEALLSEAAELGYGTEDNSAIIKVFARSTHE